MADNQPTILVKKADGTFVRVPLADLKKKPAAPVSVPPPVVPVAPVPVAPAAPVVEQKLAPAPAPEDFKSLLEEDNEIIMSELGPKASSPRDSDVDKIVKQLSFTILPSFVGRLRSAVQLRLKDVRGVSETKDFALRSIKDGGLGLTEAQADELENKCVTQMGAGEKSVVKPLKVRSAKTVVSPEEDLPQKFVEPLVPANTTPFNSFVHEEGQHHVVASAQDKIPEFKIDSALKPKPVIRDVVVKPIEMGPIEEIKFFRLVDLRRLGSNPIDAVNRLKQKFINLKEESILLFIDACLAWRESPLYQEYLGMVDLAFNKHIHLEAAIGDKEKITLEEIKAIVNMERELGI